MKSLTAKEVAELLKVTTARVYQLARAGTIPSVRLGARQLRFSEVAIMEWIAQGGSQR